MATLSFERMRCAVLLCYFFSSPVLSDGVSCLSKVENQAGKPFITNVSTISCSRDSCETPGCVTSVSQVKNYTITIAADCLYIQIQGEAYLGDKEISFHYSFQCDIFTPPPIRTAVGSLLIRGVEMEIILDNHGTPPHDIGYGSTVELSCFSHLNDSTDIPISFQFVYANQTVTARCPAAVGTDVRYVTPVTKQKWRVYRNETLPHNCILVLYNFEDSDDGNYSCSSTVGGIDVQSNVLKLQTLKGLEAELEPTKPANSGSNHDSVVLLALGIVVVSLSILLILLFIVGRYVQSRRRRRCNPNPYQTLPNQEPNEIYTPQSTSQGSLSQVEADLTNSTASDSTYCRSTPSNRPVFPMSSEDSGPPISDDERTSVTCVPDERGSISPEPVQACNRLAPPGDMTAYATGSNSGRTSPSIGSSATSSERFRSGSEKTTSADSYNTATGSLLT